MSSQIFHMNIKEYVIIHLGLYVRTVVILYYKQTHAPGFL